jgi:hypothetical protein
MSCFWILLLIVNALWIALTLISALPESGRLSDGMRGAGFWFSLIVLGVLDAVAVLIRWLVHVL